MKKTRMPDRCLGHWDNLLDAGREFDCDHEYAGEITCDECKHGPARLGLDPRFPRYKQPPHRKQPCQIFFKRHVAAITHGATGAVVLSLPLFHGETFDLRTLVLCLSVFLMTLYGAHVDWTHRNDKQGRKS